MGARSILQTEKQLRLENEELRSRLTEAEETLTAIRNGEVDAIVVSGLDGEKVFSLASAETPYRIIVEEMNEGAATLTEEGIILYCNRRFAELVSIPSEQLVGSNFARFFAENEKQKFDTLLQTILKGRSSGEITYLFKDSNPMYFRLSFSALTLDTLDEVCVIVTDITELKQKEEELRRSHDKLEQRVTERTAELNKTIEELAASNNSIKNMMEDALEAKNNLEIANMRLMEEIAERKRAEERLQESEEKYKNLVDNSLVGVYQITMEGDLIFGNEAMLKIVEYEGDDYTQLNVKECYKNPADRDKLTRILKENGEIRNFETKLISFKGNTIDVIVNARTNGDILSGTMMDITDRKKAEDSLKKSEHEFRLLAEAMPQIVWITRPDGWNIYFNQQWVDYTGQTLEESYGHGWNKPFHPDDKQQAWDAWQNATINGATYSLECRLRRADGVYKWWLIRGAPVLDSHGAILKWFGTCTDIDKLKKSEEELTIAKLHAEESDRLKSSFLANMSHEIRTPLNAIVGFSGLFSDPDLCQEEKTHYSEIIKSRSDDLLYLINDILELSRIESGNAIVTIDQVVVNDLLDELEVDMRQKLLQIKKTNLQLFSEKPLSVDQSRIISDARIIKQVFSNLIDNAIKFTESGTIRFGYKLPDNHTLTCYVSDTGIGISIGNQEVIFENFKQAVVKNPKKLYGGTGLGLSICRGSLALLGGKIWVESVPGEGSTFYFTVPFEQDRDGRDGRDDRDDRHVHIDHHDFNWSGKKILLVEDEPSNMEYLQIILDRTHAELVKVYSGSELKGIYDNLNSFDVVLLDIRLPDANGWELAREIKTRCPKLPVIAQTAYAMSIDREKSEEVGCDDHISKPINKDQLLVMLARYLK